MMTTKHTMSKECRKTIPDGERECIWAEAGVVPYKLCDFHFDCDNCTFDQVMMRGRGDAAPPNRLNIGGYGFCASLFYHPGHTWARVEENAYVRIGIDDLGQGLLGRLQEISLPGKGERIDKANIRGRARGVSFGLHPPVEGHVVAVNDRLHHQPSLLNEHPYDDGWMVLVRPVRLSKNLRKLHYGHRAQEWYSAEIQKLITLFARITNTASSRVGITLQDGGGIDFRLLDRLEHSKVKRIVTQFFLSPSGTKA